MKIKPIIWGLLSLSLLVTGLFGRPSPAQAATQPDENFVVTPLLPNNQLNSKDGYFNLKVTPGSTQVLKLSVTNPGSSSRQIDVSPVNATTADTGTIVYIPSNRTDPSAQTTFTKMTSKAISLTLAPHQGKTVTFETKIPKNGFSGEVLGGLFVTNPQTSEASTKRNAQNFQLANRYAVTTAVALWCQPNQTIPAKVALANTKVVYSKTDTAPMVVAKLRNLAPIAFGDLQVHAQLFEQTNGREVAAQTQKNRSMAPNSWFDLEMGLGDKPLPAGRYTLKLKLASGDRHWNFTQPVSLSKAHAQEHNNSTKPATGRQQSWLWFAGGGLLILLIIVGAYVLGRKHH